MRPLPKIQAIDNLELASVPDWIESSALKVYRLELDGARVSFNRLKKDQKDQILKNLAILRTCLTANEMRVTWLKVRGLFEEDPKKSHFWFISAIYLSLIPANAHFYPKSESEKFKAQALRHLQALESIVEQKLSNYYSWGTLFLVERLERLGVYIDESDQNTSVDSDGGGKGVPNADLIKEMVIGEFDGLQSLFKLLRETLDSTEYSSIFSGSQVQGESAERQYFVRSLTFLLFYKTGRKHRRTVIDTASVIFGSPIAERTVVSLTKNLPHPSDILMFKFHNLIDDYHISRYYDRICQLPDRNRRKK